MKAMVREWMQRSMALVGRLTLSKVNSAHGSRTHAHEALTRASLGHKAYY